MTGKLCQSVIQIRRVAEWLRLAREKGRILLGHWGRRGWKAGAREPTRAIKPHEQPRQSERYGWRKPSKVDGHGAPQLVHEVVVRRVRDLVPLAELHLPKILRVLGKRVDGLVVEPLAAGEIDLLEPRALFGDELDRRARDLLTRANVEHAKVGAVCGDGEDCRVIDTARRDIQGVQSLAASSSEPLDPKVGNAQAAVYIQTLKALAKVGKADQAVVREVKAAVHREASEGFATATRDRLDAAIGDVATTHDPELLELPAVLGDRDQDVVRHVGKTCRADIQRAKVGACRKKVDEQVVLHVAAAQVEVLQVDASRRELRKMHSCIMTGNSFAGSKPEHFQAAASFGKRLDRLCGDA
mmetsp:Transcript_10370/g.33086  ORF Transcript_10370/g.33086 Transcript_10370/m.33086 type:complete len:356 (-) Transcript_10370:507-1574(-)